MAHEQAAALVEARQAQPCYGEEQEDLSSSQEEATRDPMVLVHARYTAFPPERCRACSDRDTPAQ